MEALIPAPADCEVRSVIKFWMHSAWRRSKFIVSCARSMAMHGMTASLSAENRGPRAQWFPSFLHSRNNCSVSVIVFRITERRRWVSQWFQSQAADFYDTGYKSWSMVWQMFLFRRWIYWKIAQTLAVSAPINLFIKLSFVSVDARRETYFLDAPRTCNCYIQFLNSSFWNTWSGIPEEVNALTICFLFALEFSICCHTWGIGLTGWIIALHKLFPWCMFEILRDGFFFLICTHWT